MNHRRLIRLKAYYRLARKHTTFQDGQLGVSEDLTTEIAHHVLVGMMNFWKDLVQYHQARAQQEALTS